MTFEPIAIIGQSCLLPGALNPNTLWQNILANQQSLRSAQHNRWRADPKVLLQKSDRMGDHIASDQCGYVEGFEEIFDATGFHISAEELLAQDQLCQWLVHTGREALKDAGLTLQDLSENRVGTIFGNLSYPTGELNRYIESIWLAEQLFPPAIASAFKASPNLHHPQHRFMSGYPAHFMAKALGLTASAYALDAACASSLYAIALASRALQQRQADLMFAGGINLTDSLFLNLGFTALQALSPTGQSRPLHAEANGLIPAQGVGLFVLKRLSDAIADKDRIHGVIRGVGLANDGRSRGFLVPDQGGQVRAMKNAYEQSGIQPKEVSWVECHATGTAVGDAIEIESMHAVFADADKISIGALKGNIGHTITASGAAALVKVLRAFEAGVKPPTLHADELLNKAIKDTPFQVSATAESWSDQEKCIAAINCFGFGGNNAHLLVEKWVPQKAVSFQVTKTKEETAPIAIVGIGILAAGAKDSAAFMNAWSAGTSLITEYRSGLLGGYLDHISLSLDEAHFPPTDLQRTTGQQLAILKAAHEAMAKTKPSDPIRTGAWIGMQCDTEVARSGFGCRLAETFPQADEAWLTAARVAIRPPLMPADVIGAMPNIVANRLNAEFDLKAPSHVVSAEEGSGLIALDLGVQYLRDSVVDCAIVGAVDMCCEIGHRAAASNVFKVTRQIPGDAAVVLVLKRLADAKRDKDTVYALIADKGEQGDELLTLENSGITRQFGHAHAASGLLHVAAAALKLRENQSDSTAHVMVDSYGGQVFSVCLHSA